MTTTQVNDRRSNVQTLMSFSAGSPIDEVSAARRNTGPAHENVVWKGVFVGVSVPVAE